MLKLFLHIFTHRLLHRAVDEGKQSLVNVTARRMADLNKLDSKDAEGKVCYDTQQALIKIYTCATLFG